MGKFLIVNADDFGASKQISEGIIKAYRDGIVTATSVVVCGEHFDEGISLLKKEDIDVGLHLTIVGGERPLVGPVEGLVNSEGVFLKSFRDVIPRIITGRYNREALRKELFEQAGRLKDSGVDITHIDSHQHLHILPAISKIVIDIADHFNIRWIRLPRPGSLSIKGAGMNVFSGIMTRRLVKRRLRFTDYFIGFESTGGLDEPMLLSVIRNLKAGITELMVHPGYDASAKYDWKFDWEGELDALCSARAADLIKGSDVTLIRYSDL
ncbi:MAG: ChbG/HpnK family deacetylase [Nitrospirota bacterium]|nr:MAG: ChbG/HpnK family deacetylase [Nitrospirota bacterium]